MKKLILIAILIIIGFLAVVIIMGYLGRYPSFFPAFIKYNKFLPQIVTQEVFKIENFMDPEEDFSAFLKEVEKTVHERWREDAKLVYIEAFLVPETDKEAFAYELDFESAEPYCQVLKVYYNAKIILEKDSFSTGSASPYRRMYRRVHLPEFTDNKNLVSIDLTGELPCMLDTYDEVSVEEVKISGSEVFRLALIENPESIETFRNFSWFGWLNGHHQDTENTLPIFWLVLDGSRMKINATTGEILE